LNPSLPQASEERIYPGSVRQIHELAWRRGAELQAEIWDNHPDVAASWQDFLSPESLSSIRLQPGPGICFHFSDGFSGLLSILRPSSDSSPRLLFIDPSYVEVQDVHMAEKLLQEARGAGWTVLWWYMTDEMSAPAAMDALEIDFAEAGLYGGRWKGAGVAVAGSKSSQLSGLVHHLQQKGEELIRMLKWH
jgi:23S rRNA A2030 N6-methylase RlmJ